MPERRCGLRDGRHLRARDTDNDNAAELPGGQGLSPELPLPTGVPPDAIRARRVTLAHARHQRTTPLLRLRARLGWQRDPDLWTVRCRDTGVAA